MTVDELSVRYKSALSTESEMLAFPREISDPTFNQICYPAAKSAQVVIRKSSRKKKLKAKSEVQGVTLRSSTKKYRKKSAAESEVTRIIHPAQRKNTNYFRLRGKAYSNSLTILHVPQRTCTGSTTSYSSYVPLKMTEIIPHLFVGSHDNANDQWELEENGITHVLSLYKKSTVDYVWKEQFLMDDRGRTDLKEVLDKVYKFIELGHRDGNSVLVHCQLGQNRSATLVIAFLMRSKKMTLFRAHKKVKDLRPLVHINTLYAKKLLELEMELFGKNSLPPDFMDREEYDMTTGEVSYKHENITSTEHRIMYK